jgi:hypothetical protein
MKPHCRSRAQRGGAAGRGDRVFVAHLLGERAWLGKANVMRFGRCPAGYNARLCGHELAVVLVALANGLRRNASRPGRMTETAVESSTDTRSGLPLGSEAFPAVAASGCRCEAVEAASNDPSFSRKPASTRSASAAINVFLAPRFLWTQSAASSAHRS